MVRVAEDVDSHPSRTAVAVSGAGTNTISGTTEVLVAANPDRLYFECTNLDSSIVISLGFGTDAVSLTGAVLQAGETWSMPANSIWTGAINVIAASGTPTVAFLEW